MLLIGTLTGGVDFTDKRFILKDAVPEVKDATGAVVTKSSCRSLCKMEHFFTVSN